MSERHFGSSLVYKTRKEKEKRLTENAKGMQTPQNEENQVTFCINYQEKDLSKLRKRSELLDNYSQIQKLRVRQKPFPFPKMIQTKKEFNHLTKPPTNVSLNFDLFNPKKKQREPSNDRALLERIQESVILSKEKYLQKVGRHQRKKSERCSLLQSYGLNVKTAERCGLPERPTKKLAQTLVQMPLTSSSLSRSKGIQTACEGKATRKLSQSKTFLKQSDRVRSFVLKALEESDNLNLKAKYAKMTKSHVIVLQSFGHYLQENTLEKYSKVKFFVGKGNNRNLICYLLKKRWWCTETPEPSEAQFVWTQLIHKKTVKQIESVESQPFDRWEVFQKSRKLSITSEQKGNCFFHLKMREDFMKPLCQTQKKTLLKPFKVPPSLHNHVYGSEVLDNKNALFFNLEEYCSFKGRDPFQIVPLTFVINGSRSHEFEQFQGRVSELKKVTWIVKPAQNSNRGNGIFITTSLSQIKSRIQRKEKQSYVIQKYITSLFLYQKRKFDIRTYLLMLSMGGVTKFFWYQQGYIRTSSQVFDLSDLSDQFVHLTNDAVQNRNDNYGKYEEGNKLSYHQFQLYLDHNYSEHNYSMKKLSSEMKKMAIEAVKSTYHLMNRKNKIYGFQLFGLDFIVDSSFKPWLIEANTNPCLELSSLVQERIIPTMLENLFRLVLDPLFYPLDIAPKNKHHIYESCLQKNKFELIFDSLFDRDMQWQQHSLKKKEREEQ